MSTDRLITRIVELQNPTVVGVDPTLQIVPPHLFAQAHGENPFERAANALTTWGRDLVDALCDIVPAIKPQLACYEQFRYEGMKAYYDTVQYAKEKGMFVIADAKRGDIGSSSDCYANAHLGTVELYGEPTPVFSADALTINSYLGSDGILPFVRTGKLIFPLVRTSNPSAVEFQDIHHNGRPLYTIVAEHIGELGKDSIGWYGYSLIGAVVGATYPAELKALRKILPHTFFLVPGYGAQGGSAADCTGAFDNRGLGAVINSSRAILGAWQLSSDGNHFANHARTAAITMRDELRTAIGKIG